MAIERTHESRSARFRYGVDAPYVLAILFVVGMIGVIAGAFGGAMGFVVVGLLFLVQAGVYLHTTLRGKFVVWRKLLDDLDLRGDEELLDVGCGRGAVLIEASRRLTNGTAHGVDLWRSIDQSGNAEKVTRANAEAAGTSARVRLHTGDMTDLLFPDASFDVVTSSIAIHNMSSEDGRSRAIDEIARVLRPGGRLVIADIRHTGTYGAQLRAMQFADVTVRGLGPSFWFAGPWMATTVVTATKPPTSETPRVG